VWPIHTGHYGCQFRNCQHLPGPAAAPPRDEGQQVRMCHYASKASTAETLPDRSRPHQPAPSLLCPARPSPAQPCPAMLLRQDDRGQAHGRSLATAGAAGRSRSSTGAPATQQLLAQHWRCSGACDQALHQIGCSSRRQEQDQLGTSLAGAGPCGRPAGAGPVHRGGRSRTRCHMAGAPLSCLLLLPPGESPMPRTGASGESQGPWHRKPQTRGGLCSAARPDVRVKGATGSVRCSGVTARP
jgi:hypothetical protein